MVRLLVVAEVQESPLAVNKMFQLGGQGYRHPLCIEHQISLAGNGDLINGVNLVPLYIEVLKRTLCKKPLFDLKVLKNDRFLSQDHEIIKRFYMVNTFSLKSLFYFEKPCKACFA